MRNASTVLIASVALLTGCNTRQQRADKDYDTRIAHPRFASNGPAVFYDEAHREIHRASGTYQPFVSLLRNDGYRVLINKQVFDSATLAGAKALVIVNAAGRNQANDFAAFTPSEVAALEKWVEGGGGLLLVVDHYPFSAAASLLAQAFGARVGPGMTEDSTNYDTSTRDQSQLVFSRSNGLLGEHAITKGINRIITFTGTSIQPPANADILLRLSSQAFDMQPTAREENDGSTKRLVVSYDKTTAPTGPAQGIAFIHGRGRVVILGEAGCLSAQVDGVTGKKFGMNLPGTDNRQFALNIMAWLTQ